MQHQVLPIDLRYVKQTTVCRIAILSGTIARQLKELRQVCYWIGDYSSGLFS